MASEVNLREHTSHRHLPSVNKAADSGFETQRCHQKSKMGGGGGVGISGTVKKEIYPPNFFKKVL